MIADIDSSAAVSDSRNVISLSFRKRHCERPRFIRNSRRWVRCGSGDFAVCNHCASIRSLDKKRLIGSGCNASSLDGISFEDLRPYRFFFVTFTAPSFGKIRDGVPVDASRYEYRRQVEWNQISPALFHATMISLERRLPGSEWCFVREWQKRGAIHFHGIVRVPKWVDAREAWREIKALRVVESSGISWGRQMDVQSVNDEATSRVRYMSKIVSYTAKHQGNRGMLSPEVAAFYARLDKHARNLVCRRRECGIRRDCDGRVHRSHGYAGRMLSMSKGWSLAGLTFGSLREQRAAFIAGKVDAIQQTELAEAARLAKEDYTEAFAGIEASTVVAGKARLRATLDASLARDKLIAMDYASPA